MTLAKIRDYTLTLIIIMSLILLINWLSSDGTKRSMALDKIEGHARIIDADSFFIGKDEIRLYGIDAPEGKQFCQNIEGKDYACGHKASQALKKHLHKKTIECAVQTWDRYNRAVSVCYVEGADLNDWLVRRGHAMAYRKYTHKYVNAENEAKKNGSGIWQGKFLSPWQWRHINRHQ